MLHGAPVQVAYGTLGANILAQGLERTQSHAAAMAERNHASPAGSDQSCELVHVVDDAGSLKNEDSVAEVQSIHIVSAPALHS